MLHELWVDPVTGYTFCETSLSGSLPAFLGCGAEWVIMARSIMPDDPSPKQIQEGYEENVKSVRRLINKHGHPAVAWAILQFASKEGQATLQRIKEYYGKSK